MLITLELCNESLLKSKEWLAHWAHIKVVPLATLLD